MFNLVPEGEHRLVGGGPSLELGKMQQNKMNGSPLKIPNPFPGHVLVQRPLPVVRERWFPINPQRAGLFLPGFCGSSWRPPSLVPWREVVSEACTGRSWAVFQHVLLTQSTEKLPHCFQCHLIQRAQAGTKPARNATQPHWVSGYQHCLP